MPHALAGLRSEPPMSLPRPIADMPVAGATASPPLDPPAVQAAFHGLRVRPCRLLSVWMRMAMSGRFVRPTGIAPAARMRSTTGASSGTTAPERAGGAHVVAGPAMSMFSLTVIGTPASGPTAAPAAIRLSRAAASARGLGQHHDHGIERRVHRLDPGEVRVDHLDAGDLPGRDYASSKAGRAVRTPRSSRTSATSTTSSMP